MIAPILARPVSTIWPLTSSRMVLRWQDHEETYVAGDAYYAPPGHLPLLTAGTSLIEFSPTNELEVTMAVLERNMTAAEVSL